MPPFACVDLQCWCRDLYLTYVLMLCESFNYFSLSLMFVLYLTQEFGVGDVEVSCMPQLRSTPTLLPPMSVYISKPHKCLLVLPNLYPRACIPAAYEGAMLEILPCRAARCTGYGAPSWWPTALCSAPQLTC